MTDIRLICLDIDGTLLGADHATVPERNVRALRAGIGVCRNGFALQGQFFLRCQLLRFKMCIRDRP